MTEGRFYGMETNAVLQAAPLLNRVPSLTRVASLKRVGSLAKAPVPVHIDTPLHPTHRARKGHRHSIEISVVDYDPDLDANLSQDSLSSEEAATIFPKALRSQLGLSPSRFGRGNQSMEEAATRPLTFREQARTNASWLSKSLDSGTRGQSIRGSMTERSIRNKRTPYLQHRVQETLFPSTRSRRKSAVPSDQLKPHTPLSQEALRRLGILPEELRPHTFEECLKHVSFLVHIPVFTPSPRYLSPRSIHAAGDADWPHGGGHWQAGGNEAIASVRYEALERQRCTLLERA